MKIITAEERMAEARGAKILIVGPAGIGKTSLLRTVNPKTTLFFDLEAGDLSVQDVPVDQVRATTWRECRDLACFLGGPNLNIKDHNKPYSEAHYNYVAAEYGDASSLDKYELYFVDSITVAARLCLAWCQEQPEAFNKDGKLDLRGAYGLLGREMIAWVSHLQRTKRKNVVFVGLLEMEKDDFNRSSWQLQIDGKKAGREIPGIVDEVLAMGDVFFEGDDTSTRVLITNHEAGASVYPGLIAKDRSGLLNDYEQPHLGDLITKLTRGRGMREAAE